MNEQILNTSGQGKDAVVPKEVQFNNYGAFVLTYFWLKANDLSGKKIITELRDNEDIFIYLYRRVSFGLLSRGNIAAWKYRHWDSIENFVRIQKKWNLAGKTALTILFLGFSLTVLLAGFRIFQALLK